MTKPSSTGDNMRKLLSGIADEGELTFDQLFKVFELVSTNQREAAMTLLIELLGRTKDLNKVLDKLKVLDITAAKALLNKVKE